MPRTARPESLTVSAVNALAREVLEQSIGPLWVQGEVTGWKRHTSGHCYFALRDRSARLRAVMWRTEAQRLPTEPDEGLEVRALGTLSLYEKTGEYQFIARAIEGLGAGGLWRIAFEKLRRKLDEEGLLAPERKRPIPRFPEVVGVVTSPVGAALHDILHVIGLRAPWVRVLLSPARVQGDGAGSDVARAIRLLARSGLPDVIIVGRGGGSAEDLWAFNEETVARTIVNCRVPVISAVGHEVDTTIADLVADWRAPTPSAAAERAVPDGDTVHRDLTSARLRMAAALRRWVSARRSRLTTTANGLTDSARYEVQRRIEKAGHLAEKLNALSPLGALRRGYAVPVTESGHVLRRAAEFTPGQRFSLRVADGHVPSRVDAPPASEGPA
jgi:exodeoxyribonuclease VII large subunit